ncbi:hypothetical protein [Sphingopyxis granuli]|uniref:hypothetical protein n=1 Tax=Sphingopyxis granuli TaxID=267128 RepID=UPI00301BD339
MTFVGFRREVGAVAAKDAILLRRDPPDDAHEPNQRADALVDGIERRAAPIGPCLLLDDRELLDDVLTDAADDRVPEDGAARAREFDSGVCGLATVEEIDQGAVRALDVMPLRKPVREKGLSVAEAISETCCNRRHHPNLFVRPAGHVNRTPERRNSAFQMATAAGYGNG